MARSPADYAALATSAHNRQPKFIATLKLGVQPFVDAQSMLAGMEAAFDLDTASGAQLDVVGLWVGITRRVGVPLQNVYFAWDTVNLGWDQGAWKGPYDTSDGLINLDDGAYRTLIRAKIAANIWDGTMTGAQAVLQQILTGHPGILYLEDRQDMSMVIGLAGPWPDAVTRALISAKYIHLVPAGVLANFVITSVPGTPVFGFDVTNSNIAGWDVGSWAIPNS